MPPADSSVQKPLLLIVDDDEKFCTMLADYLDPHGYELNAVHSGTAALTAIVEEPWQAVILDVMLPGIDGFEVLKRIRTYSTVPVLMLTGRGEEIDRIVGLEVGADDYVSKTASMRELLARLRALLRRSAIQIATPSGINYLQDIVIGEIRISPSSRVVSVGDQPIELRPVEIDLLICLAQSVGRVLSRDQLLDHVRDREWEVFDRSIDVHISSLRRKLGDDAKNPHIIRTCRSAGYMFINPSAPH
ncbi:MAG: response regulator transcription factor [Akkermansiaceae bacterium]|nr:response regulator transcription factor [Akkermansiaceae bacterium]